MPSGWPCLRRSVGNAEGNPRLDFRSGSVSVVRRPRTRTRASTRMRISGADPVETMHPADHEILKHFRQIRQRTIDLVERIPEEMLTRQADGEALPLGRLFKHIAYTVDSWMDDFLLD